jgi:hypothetical protein
VRRCFASAWIDGGSNASEITAARKTARRGRACRGMWRLGSYQWPRQPVPRPAIAVAETTLNKAGVPSKLTLVAPVRSVPRIRMAAPDMRQCFHERPETYGQSEYRATAQMRALLGDGPAKHGCPVEVAIRILDPWQSPRAQKL